MTVAGIINRALHNERCRAGNRTDMYFTLWNTMRSDGTMLNSIVLGHDDHHQKLCSFRLKCHTDQRVILWKTLSQIIRVHFMAL